MPPPARTDSSSPAVQGDGGADGHRADEAGRTAKGGIVIAIAQELQVPVKFVGLGEGIGDLAPFDAKEFVSDLF